MDISEFFSSLELPKEYNKDLALQTLTHKSFAMDAPDNNIPFNERLEFLWDSILGAVIASMLYERFPNIPESQLTLSKIYLVKEATLADAARSIRLWKIVRIGIWEKRSWGADKDSVLSDTLEALIAFIYLEFGRKEVEKFIAAHIYSRLGDSPIMPQKSAKNRLQELVQKYYNEIPRYESVILKKNASGDIKLFGANVSVRRTYICQWSWRNKKKAEEQAAKEALNLLHVEKRKIVFEGKIL